jgi:hypothetical protein
MSVHQAKEGVNMNRRDPVIIIADSRRLKFALAPLDAQDIPRIEAQRQHVKFTQF